MCLPIPPHSLTHPPTHPTPLLQVKPGTMMDIVTNIHSKRKTETMISFYQGRERREGGKEEMNGWMIAWINIILSLLHTVTHPPPHTLPSGERSYGADAYSLLTRRPEVTYARLPTLLGRHDEHPSVALLEAAYFPTKVTRRKKEGVPSHPPTHPPTYACYEGEGGHCLLPSSLPTHLTHATPPRCRSTNQPAAWPLPTRMRCTTPPRSWLP